mmetsp:Transcript_11158/g.20185  ORF Transcript_11158/g.20185 Transcript_11158/m.20185 type:complete len:288 (-) Transcript_11158:145-1008(-)
MSNKNLGFVTQTADDVKGRSVVPKGDPKKFVKPSNSTAPMESEASANTIAFPFMQPCSLSGLSSAISSGSVGYMFGVLPSLIFNIRNIKISEWRKYHNEGMSSAKSFAGMTGLYTFFHCLSVRLRQTDDSMNRLIAGAASGLVLGWSGGPMGALQNAVIVGVLSYFFDGSKSTSSAKASPCLGGACGLRHQTGDNADSSNCDSYKGVKDPMSIRDRKWRRQVGSLVRLTQSSALNHLRGTKPQPALTAIALVFNQGYFDVCDSSLGLKQSQGVVRHGHQNTFIRASA